MPLEHSILIVENDTALLDLLTRNFIQRGYAVTPVCHPRQALEAVAVNSFDLALLDGSLPEHDGIWLMRELKLHVADLQVIILSAHSDAAFQRKCIDNGAFAYLRKPCGLFELEATFERAIELRASTDETPVSRRPAARTVSPLLLIGLLALVVGCAKASNPPQADRETSTTDTLSTPAAATDTARSTIERAVCVIRPIGDSRVSGSLHLVKLGDEIEIQGEIDGLKPGEHGFHVHELGDLTDGQTGKSAGAHFNPDQQPHGAPDAGQRHVGDLGNITAEEDGKAIVDIRDRVIQFNGPESIIGRCIVIHADADKFTQPSGDAGDRVAFGVIGIAANQ
jgi:Cu-Zn family superoxide dismutase